MNKHRLLSSVLFSVLFVGTVFLAVILNHHIILLSILASIFSALAIISMLKMAPANRKTEHPHKGSTIMILTVLSSILVCIFCFFLILFLLGKESLDWQLSVLGIFANASLLYFCHLYKK